MSTALIIIGLVVILAGVVVFIRPVNPPPPDPATIDRAGVDIGKILEELNKMLDKLDKRFRPGFILMVVGLTLVALGVFVETKDANDNQDDTAYAYIVS